MNIVLYLQELDHLIIEYTKPPVTAMLRNKLSLALEQAEAHADAVAKQEKTLARQSEAYDQLKQEKLAVDAKLLAVQTANVKLEAEITGRKPEDAKGIIGQRQPPLS